LMCVVCCVLCVVCCVLCVVCCVLCVVCWMLGVGCCVVGVGCWVYQFPSIPFISNLQKKYIFYLIVTNKIFFSLFFCFVLFCFVLFYFIFSFFPFLFCSLRYFLGFFNSDMLSFDLLLWLIKSFIEYITSQFTTTTHSHTGCDFVFFVFFVFFSVFCFVSLFFIFTDNCVYPSSTYLFLNLLKTHTRVRTRRTTITRAIPTITKIILTPTGEAVGLGEGGGGEGICVGVGVIMKVGDGDGDADGIGEGEGGKSR
jgi:hypothetical protein